MYYSNGNYEAFAHPEKPEGIEKKRAVVDLRIEEGEEPAFVPSLANLQAKQPKNVLESVV